MIYLNIILAVLGLATVVISCLYFNDGKAKYKTILLIVIGSAIMICTVWNAILQSRKDEADGKEKVRLLSTVDTISLKLDKKIKSDFQFEAFLLKKNHIVRDSVTNEPILVKVNIQNLIKTENTANGKSVQSFDQKGGQTGFDIKN